LYRLYKSLKEHTLDGEKKYRNYFKSHPLSVLGTTCSIGHWGALRLVSLWWSWCTWS